MRPVFGEWLAAGVVLGCCTWLGATGWSTYQAAILPSARVVPTPTPTPYVDPEVAREEGRRQRLVMDHVGAGIALRNTNQRQGAIEEFQKALAIDPSNYDARENLRQMGVELPPGPAATPTAARPTPLPTVTPRIQR